MRNRSSLVVLFALSLAAACGYDPKLKNAGLGPDGGGGGGGSVDGAAAVSSETGASEAGKVGEAGGGTGIDGGGAGSVDVAGSTGGVEAGGEAAGPYDGALDKPEDVPSRAIDGSKDGDTGGNGGAGGAGGLGGTGGIGGAGEVGKDAPIATGGTGGAGAGGASGDGGASGSGSGGVLATGGASTSPDAAVTGGASGSGGGLVGSGGAQTGGATGTPPDIEPSTTTLTLGDAPMGESSGEGTFTLTNLGQQTSGPIRLASTSADFVIRTTGDNTCISDTTTLAQNISCTVRVVLTPASLGAKSAFITFQAGSGASGHVTVSGNGTPGASLSTGSTTTLSFPLLVTVGVASPVGTFTVTNVGPRTSGAISATSDNPDFAVQTGTTGDCTGATLLPNGTCTVRVIMTPSMAGSLSGKISVSASPGGTANVTASGTSCTANAHDDGTGTCAPLYTCGANYHNGGTGKCVPNQACSTDQLTNDNGICVPMVGVNWVQQSIGASNVAVSADGSKLIATLTIKNQTPSQVYTSANGGQNWTYRTLPAPEDWSSVTSSADGTKLAVIGSSSIYASTDSGSTWSRQGAGLWAGGAAHSVVASTADGTTLVYAGDALQVSSDMGHTWNSRSDATMSPGTLFALAMSDDGTYIYTAGVFGAGSYRLYASSNAGLSWSMTDYEVSVLMCSADGKKVVRAWGGVYTSTDSGGSWQTRACSACGGPGGSSANGNLFVLSYIYGTMISTDSGNTWTARTVGSGPPIAVAVSASGSTVAVITDPGYGYRGDLYISTGPVP